MNFGIIKENVINAYIKSFVSGNDKGKKLFKEYLTLIKKPILKDQFIIYNNLQNTILEDEKSASSFLIDNLNILRKHKKKLNESNKVMIALLKKYGVKITENVDNKELYKHITTLLNSKKANNLSEFYKAKKALIAHLTRPQKIVPVIESRKFPKIPASVMAKLLVNKYNHRYTSELNESEIKMVRTIVKGNDSDKSELMKSMVESTLKTVRQKISSSDDSTYQKLRAVENKLCEMTYNKETYINDMIRLDDLNKSLSNEDSN